MTATTTEMPVRNIAGLDLSRMLDREWLVTNGLGGFATGTICGASTRRYHGLLVAAHPAPLGRLMMFNHLTEQFRFPDFSVAKFGGVEKAGSKLEIHGADVLTDFRLDAGLPIWRFESNGHVIEKQLFMPYGHNTVHVIYRLLSGPGPVRLKLRPSVHFRDYDAPVNIPFAGPYKLIASQGVYEIEGEHSGYPNLRLMLDGEHAALTVDGMSEEDVLYRVEENRGYEGIGTLYSPGQFRVNLRQDRPVVLSASTEPWALFQAVPAGKALELERARRTRLIAEADAQLQTGFGAELVLAADQFIITPATRPADIARATAAGVEARTIIAGYHWFTDWGRDTMISLEGLTLVTGRHAEAKYILHTFANHVRNGLIPNYFPDGANKGVYHTADATMWFFHALSRYIATTGDRETLRELLPTLRSIIAHHESGTDFGIGMDPADGLLKQGAEGYQLTWMDAKVDGWVVTPRRGKAVEINALWYNALVLLAGWLKQEGEADGERIQKLANRAQSSFNERFWNPAANCLFDVVDKEGGGNDPACRPNQVFAISLPNPVLHPSRWAAVMEVVEKKLFTPVGLRSLAPGEPDYKDKYYGDLRSRDAAYHQGTVWGWLIGPFVDAWKKTNPQHVANSRRWLAGFESHMSEACVGSISEVFDAESPFTPRACIAQAWSVAEVARCWAQSSTGGGDRKMKG
ncbi:amylo-alpha-1,6-glucosidase [Limnoglobus roseus]|uniref:Inverting amylo-alpha-1,6-glucosidase n=1 Tax=Limnoglobus roseus TaxID=2598579 RepID=A0A5C1AS82_9BACT|nr:amylo-alpha-1,6-glucosidase [Limnoglobus roseus]QEL19748.1 inverting amylo-alpha-1,6-glucosidase [Limnoglobus roseus]